MNLTLKFLRPFKDIIGKSEIEINTDFKTLRELLNSLIEKYPELEKEFFKENHELTDYICIFVNDKPISALNMLETELKNNDNLLFFVPVSGG